MRIGAFIFIFSILSASMSAHQVQLVTYHEKTNGVLIRIVVSNIPDVDNIAGWVGQENWFYLTLNKSVFGEDVLDNLKSKSPILEIEGIQNKESIQIGFLMEYQISDFEIFHSPSNRVFLIHVWNDLDVKNIADIKQSEKSNKHKIFSLPQGNVKNKPFYDTFINAREKYGPEKYFVWYNNWYSTEDETDRRANTNSDTLDMWDRHWSGSNKEKDSSNNFYGPIFPDKEKNITELKSELASKIKKYDSSKVIGKKNVLKKEQIIKKENNIINKPIIKKPDKDLQQLKNDIKERKKKSIKNIEKENSNNITQSKKDYNNRESKEDLAAYGIVPNLNRRKTYLKIGCDLKDVYVYLDGKKVGKTPLNKRVPVSSGWHRIRIDVPGAKKFNKSGIPTPDFRDVYVTKGRTQKVTFKFLNKTENPG